MCDSKGFLIKNLLPKKSNQRLKKYRFEDDIHIRQVWVLCINKQMRKQMVEVCNHSHYS